jgi:hypothetical protein
MEERCSDRHSTPSFRGGSGWSARGRPRPGAADLTARAIIDASLYLVLATADGTGRPWSSPVYCAHDGYAEFLWVSAPDAAHSLDITARPQIGIVIVDSHAPIGTGQGVYMSAVAVQVDGDDLRRGIETFSRRSLAHGGAEWAVNDMHAESGLRLYRARTESYSILAKDGRPDHRIPAHPAGQFRPPDRVG